LGNFYNELGNPYNELGDQYNVWGINTHVGGSMENSGGSTSFSLTDVQSSDEVQGYVAHSIDPPTCQFTQNVTNPVAVLLLGPNSCTLKPRSSTGVVAASLAATLPSCPDALNDDYSDTAIYPEGHPAGKPACGLLIPQSIPYHTGPKMQAAQSLTRWINYSNIHYPSYDSDALPPLSVFDTEYTMDVYLSGSKAMRLLPLELLLRPLLACHQKTT
jgi:hypothetical protein